ncbi:MAG TPA: FecR family protein [Pseudobdellovibrionaceae bacterium]|nr:FecR family protein [Pseudobdellovibrionaceae bacterium]
MQRNKLLFKVSSNFKIFMVLSIFFSGAVAFAEEMYGLLMVVKGDVKILKTDQSVTPAKVGGKILPKDSIVTGADSRAKIVMSDRNVINVSPDTKMEISKYVNDSKSGLKDVEIKLDQGKVRNNVEQSYDGEKSKFIMKTPTAVAGVRGTQFVTSFNAKTNVSSVVAIRGQVTFTSMANGKPVGSPVVVSKGEGVSAESGAPAPQPAPVSAKEMKEIDRETSSSGKKSDSAKQEGGPGTSNGGNSGEKGEGSGDKKSPSSSEGSKSGSGSGGSANMVDSGDLNPGMARDIKSQAPPPPPPGFNQGGPRPPTPPPTNNLVRDIIRENNGKTRVIIQPKTPTPNP